MTERPPVAVVFATLDSAATLPALLDALSTTEWPDLQVIAVDCGSRDDSRRILRERMQRADLSLLVLDAPERGRATALQLGILAAGEREVVRLHADVVPDSTDWLLRLHDVVRREPDCGIVGAKIVLAGGRVESCGRNLISGLGIVPEWSDLRFMEGDPDEPSAPREVDGVSGALCWIRRAVLEATGGLDTNFDPVFGDDDDLCLRARYHGFRVLVEPAVRAVHYAPRRTQLTHPVVPRTGPLGRQLELRSELQRGHRDYWRRKWGFDPQAPDLHEVRRRYGHTRICWRIGADRLTETLPAVPAVDVCFVTWNSLAVLPRCLDHLAATRWPHVRIWITDNGSTDGTVDYLRERAKTFPFPLEVEALPQNIGVAQGLNAAIVRGSAPIVARLDDDAFVPPDWLERMVPRFHQRPFAGMVGPRMLNDNEGAALQNGPTREWPSPLPGIGPQQGDKVHGLARVVTIRGCCNLYRRSVFAIVGLFDVRFSPSQFDEWDHHIACAVAGYEALYDGSVAVRHLLQAGRQSTPAAIGNFAGNQLKTNSKWGGAHWSALDRAIDLSNDGRWLPPDGDTSSLLRMLPPVPEGPLLPVARDPEELRQRIALGRERSALRRVDGPVGQSFAQHIAVCRQETLAGRPWAQALVMALMDLAPQHADALLTIAEFRLRDGDLPAARRTAIWGCRLRPDDEALAARRDAILAGPGSNDPVLPPASPIARDAAHRRARVLLLPPLGPCRPEVHTAMAAVEQALAAVDVAARTEWAAVPDLDGIEVVHAFDLGEWSALVGRLQVVRAMRPDIRVVLSPLQTDPGEANWIGQVVGKHAHATAVELRTLFAHAAVGRVELEGRRGRSWNPPPNEVDVAFERRCLAFVDRVVQHSDAAAAWLAARHPEVPPQTVLREAVAPGPVPDAIERRVAAELPAGGVLLLGPRDLPGNHRSAVLALADTDVPLTSYGDLAFPFTDAQTLLLGGNGLRFLPAADPATAVAALRRSAVLVWLPSDPVSFAVPLLAMACGAEVVATRCDAVTEALGPSARFVDPFDLPAIRAAVLAARSRWLGRHATPGNAPLPWDPASYGAALVDCYGLSPAVPTKVLPRRTPMRV